MNRSFDEHLIHHDHGIQCGFYRLFSELMEERLQFVVLLLCCKGEANNVSSRVN